MNLLLRSQTDAHRLGLHPIVVRCLLDKLVSGVLLGWRAALQFDVERVLDLVTLLFIGKYLFGIFLLETLLAMVVRVIGVDCIEGVPAQLTRSHLLFSI